MVAGSSDEMIDLEWNGRRVRWRVTRHHDAVYVTGASGTVTATILPRFPVPGQDAAERGFAAPMPGVVLEVRVEPGQSVAQGQTMVVLEGMKMEHHVSAPAPAL